MKDRRNRKMINMALMQSLDALTAAITALVVIGTKFDVSEEEIEQYRNIVKPKLHYDELRQHIEDSNEVIARLEEEDKAIRKLFRDEELTDEEKELVKAYVSNLMKEENEENEDDEDEE